jgi:hypothetical protein
MIEFSTHETVVVTESIYYVNGQPSNWVAQERIRTEQCRYSSNTKIGKSKSVLTTSGTGLVNPLMKHLRSNDCAEESNKMNVLKIRTDNRQTNSPLTQMNKNKSALLTNNNNICLKKS